MKAFKSFPGQRGARVQSFAWVAPATKTYFVDVKSNCDEPLLDDVQANVDLSSGAPLPGHEGASTCSGVFNMEVHGADMSTTVILPVIRLVDECALAPGSSCQTAHDKLTSATELPHLQFSRSLSPLTSPQQVEAACAGTAVEFLMDGETVASKFVEKCRLAYTMFGGMHRRQLQLGSRGQLSVEHIEVRASNADLASSLHDKLQNDAIQDLAVSHDVHDVNDNAIVDDVLKCADSADCNHANHAGSCIVAEGRCECAVGWMGADCSIQNASCATSPCQNGGTCHAIGCDGRSDSSYTCGCVAGYVGPTCALWDPIWSRCGEGASPGRNGRCECQSGTFHSIENGTEICRPCPAYATCSGGAFDVAVAVNCPAGYEADEFRHSCVPCALGKVRPSQGLADICQPCQLTEEPNKNKSICVCKLGHLAVGPSSAVSCFGLNDQWKPVSPGTSVAQCVLCSGREYECVNCPGGLLLPTPLAGYSAVEQPNTGQTSIFACPSADACQNGGGCHAGNTGPLCQVCDAGHFKASGQSACVQCRHATVHRVVRWPFFVGGTTLLIALISCLACTSKKRKKPHSAQMSDVHCHNPLSAIIMRHDTATNEEFKPQSQYKRQSRWWMIVRVNLQTIRVVVGFAQVVGQLGPVLRVKFPAYVTELILHLRAMVSFEFVHVFQCVGLKGFYWNWAIHVFLLPLIGLVFCSAVYCYHRRWAGISAQKAMNSLRANLFTVVFLVHPTVSHWTFSAFSCRRLSSDLEVLVADYSIHCYDHALHHMPSDYRLCYMVSVFVALFIALGIPVGLGLVLREQRRVLAAATVPAVVAAHVATELKLSNPDAATQLMTEVELGEEYGFLLNAFKSDCYGWELLEMLRKVVLVGALVICLPGSLFQVWLAALISLGFLTSHFYFWPYKLTADNILKATIEILIVVSILVALVLQSDTKLMGESVPEAFYDAVLVICYTSVPLACIAAFRAKTREAQGLLSGQATQSQTAFKLHLCGLANETNRQVLFDLFASARAKAEAASLDELVQIIEGRGMGVTRKNSHRGENGHAQSEIPFCWRMPTVTPQGVVQPTSTIEKQTGCGGQSIVSPDSINPFAKFSGGYEGTYADIGAYHGGLVKLIGEPQKNVDEAVRAEHCDVTDGFGASQVALTTNNYGVVFTPEIEYHFVTDTDFAQPMSCGVEPVSQRPPISGGLRRWIDIRELSNPRIAVSRIKKSFREMGWPESGVTVSVYKALHVTQVELIALRLYTGPCFILYNGVLRAMGTNGIVKFGFPKDMHGTSVRGRFTTTLHAINSGLMKMSRLQPKCRVYRGVYGMRLPRSFLQPDEFGVRSGVEYGFSSTTVDRKIAEQYSKGKDEGQPSMIFEMEMGMVNRGAFLRWISQYPHEAEILLPPLTGLEVSNCSENADGTVVFAMQLNINMQSMTIEEVLGLRHRQCIELADVVNRTLSSCMQIGDMPRRYATAAQQLAAIKAEPDANIFNDNTKFVEITKALVAQLPRLGDQLEVLHPHEHQPVLALTASSGGRFPYDTVDPCIISGDRDGTIAMTTMEGHSVRHLGSAVLSLAMMESCGMVAVGMQNKSVELMSIHERSTIKPTKLLGHPGPVTALAWLPPRRWLACGSKGVQVWQLGCGRDAQMRWHIDDEDMIVRGLSWVHIQSINDFWPASSSLQGKTIVWGFEPSMSVQVRLGGHTSAVCAVAFGLDGRVSTASNDRSIIVWDLPNGHKVTHVRQSHDQGVCSLATVGEAHLASGSADSTIKLWRLQKDVERCAGSFVLVLEATMSGHSGPVHALACLNKQGWLASSGNDGSVRLWRVADPRDKDVSPISGSSSGITKKIASIFDWLDPRRTGFANYTALQRLAAKTGGQLTAIEYVRLCCHIGCNPDVGVSREGLVQIYDELGVGNVQDDLVALGLDKT